MDGKLNCSMTAENAAFTKIRHLENRVVETETRLDVLEQETTQLDNDLQNALTDLGEKVETESVDTTSLNADTVDATHIEADSITTPELTATTIEAETIDVDNLENVNVLHGKTVDVEKTIATIGQFTETQTTTANNETTNTAELNVYGETNLTGQVNIDGNVTFTKDNGLSKLQGNYLEIDAANVVIDNKNSSEYALYVPGINGDALFGGSVAVQDTLATKNLMVTEEAHFSHLTLNENTVLENPTLENIAQTQELTDKALDIDENGKLVRKFVAGGSAGTVANALIANETIYVSGTAYQVEKVKIDRTQADFTDVPVTANTITINDKATIGDIETSTIETSTIDAEVIKTIDAEVDGMKFYRGKWYDKVFSSAKPLVDYILDTTDKSPYQTYNILFTENVLDFRAADLPDTAITSSQVIGTYKVYSDSNDDVRELNFVENGYDPLNIGFNLFNNIHFYGFETQLDVASKDNTRCLHLNNCTLHFKDNYGTNTSVGKFKLNKCNNVNIMAAVNWNAFPRPEWENCNNVQLRNWGFVQGIKYSIDVWMVNCDDCYVAVPYIQNGRVSFGQVGKGSNLVVFFESEYGGTKKEPTYTTSIQ